MTSVTELLKQKRQQTADKRMGMKKPYRFKGGTTSIRILPGWRKDDPTFSHSFGNAFIKTLDGELLAVVGDRKMTYGEDDPIRNLIQRAMSEAVTDAQREHFKEMLAKPRELVNALILDDKEVDPTVPQIIEFSENMFDQILGQVELSDIAEEFLDLDKGFNLKVNKTGTGLSTRYSFTFDRKPTKVDKAVMDNVVDLDSYVRSQFSDTDRAINALKTISQGANVTPKSLSYSGDDALVEGDYNSVDTADSASFVEHRNVSDSEIDALFENDD